MKLRTHFVLLVSATLVPVLVLAIGILLLGQREWQASVEGGLQDTARALAVAVDRELASTVTALRTLGASPSLDDRNFQLFYEQARRARDDNPGWLTVYLVEASGHQVLTLLRPLGTVLPNAGAFEYVRAVRETGQPHVSNLEFGPVSQRQVITINVPVFRDGRVRYVLGASLVTDALADLLARQVRSGESLAAIRDRNDILVARSRDHHRYVGRPPTAEFADKLRIARQRGEDVFDVESLDGPRVYAAVSRVPTSDFAVVVAVPFAAVVDAPHKFWWVLSIGTVVIFASALGVSALLARRIARPMAHLSKAAAELARGELISPSPPSSVPEVAAVRDAMVRAADALRERSAEHERRLAAETAHAEAEQRMRILERVGREKDEFLAMLGHELRNPLGAVANAMAVLNQVGSQEKAAVRARAVIDRQVEHLVGVVHDLLDVSRVTLGKIVLTRRPVDLAEVVRRSLENLDTAARTSRHDITFESEPVWVDGDEIRLEQITNNLLANALKYTPPGGRIWVTVGAEEGQAVLRVQDTGIGILADRLPLIFDLFFQGERGLDRSQGGLGIGLTLAKRLVELHGGTIAAASEGPNRGTTFTIRLPRVAPASARREAVAGDRGVRRRVLIIEDNDDAREMLKTSLEVLGHTVYEAEDGVRGVERASTLQPDVAVVDIGLPGLDGYDVARRVRALPGGTRMLLIAVTGYGQPDDRRRSREVGFDAHLVKPVGPDELDRLIASGRDA
jgi:signal transduction histidine kinase